MASKALIRLLLILALILAANTIKPLSSTNLASQFGGIAGSISTILPDSTANTLSQANYLVSAVGRSLAATTLLNPTDRIFLASADASKSLMVRKAKPAAREAGSVGAVKVAALKVVNAKPRVQPIVLPAIFPTEQVLAMSYSFVQAAFGPMSSMKRYRMPRLSVRPVRLVLPPPSTKNACEPAPLEKGREAISTEDLAPMIEAEFLLNDEIPMAFFSTQSTNPETPSGESAPTAPVVQECENEPKGLPVEAPAPLLVPLVPMY
jgi:hypothetical protein